MSSKKKAKGTAKSSKAKAKGKTQKKGTPGPKPKYGKTKLNAMFNMKVTKAERDFIRKKGGSAWVRERLGLSTGA